MTAKRTIGLIGAGGWLGRAIGAAMLKTGFVGPSSLFLSSRSGPSGAFAAWPQVRWTFTNQQLAERAEVIILSVRPEQFPGVEINVQGKLVISVMAGVSVRTLIARTGSSRVIRAMPNAAAEIGKSYTPWFAAPDVTDNDTIFTQNLFKTCGTADEVPLEADIDYLTGLTGSGPAFPALLASAMLSHALSKGLPASIARRAVEGVVAGASQMIARQGAAPDELVRTFLEYKGTTAAGLQAMIERGFESVIYTGLDAAESAAVKMAGTQEKKGS